MMEDSMIDDLLDNIDLYDVFTNTQLMVDRYDSKSPSNPNPGHPYSFYIIGWKA